MSQILILGIGSEVVIQTTASALAELTFLLGTFRWVWNLAGENFQGAPPLERPLGRLELPSASLSSHFCSTFPVSGTI